MTQAMLHFAKVLRRHIRTVPMCQIWSL